MEAYWVSAREESHQAQGSSLLNSRDERPCTGSQTRQPSAAIFDVPGGRPEEATTRPLPEGVC